MRKRSSCLLLIVLILTVTVLFGCGSTETDPPATSEVTKEEALEESKPKNDKTPKPDTDNTEQQKVLIEGAGERILELTEGLSYFTIVESIEVYQQGDKTWAVVKTTEKKDYDDGDWGKEIARLTILNAFGTVAYLDEVLVTNVDGVQIASMRNWLGKE